MKHITLLLAILILLSACAPTAEPGAGAPASDALLVTAGENQKSFSAQDMQALPSAEATFKDITYKGVTIKELMEAVGLAPEALKALKAVASDGYTANYDPAQVLKDNVLVAYALADGSPLTPDDGSFRMVLPDEEGKLNIRKLVELQFIQ